eukprot:GEMP01069608.1.p1 GENE.GEMP01069608.1~~GEMP01069608.1.p1  ORF type:complete len:104 (+),score=0.36 GEMP01069608.1:63-374(+)
MKSTILVRLERLSYLRQDIHFPFFFLKHKFIKTALDSVLCVLSGKMDNFGAFRKGMLSAVGNPFPGFFFDAPKFKIQIRFFRLCVIGEMDDFGAPSKGMLSAP